MTNAEAPPSSSREPFYVEPGCCLLCGVPEGIAPELFRTGDESCFFIRQPATRQEIDKTIEAMWSSEVQCIRYRGSDPAIWQRLGEADLADLSDDERARNHAPVARDRVAFSLRASPLQASPPALAEAFRNHLRTMEHVTARRNWLRRATVSLTWYGPRFHKVTFKRAASGDGFIAALAPVRRHTLQGLARIVDNWLKNEAHALDIAWYSRSNPNVGESGTPNPL